MARIPFCHNSIYQAMVLAWLVIQKNPEDKLKMINLPPHNDRKNEKNKKYVVMFLMK